MIICIDYHYENGYRSIRAIPMDQGKSFDMPSSLFKMSDGKKQKSTKLYQIFAAQPVEKKCQDTTASETDARLQDCQCDYDNLGYSLNR